MNETQTLVQRQLALEAEMVAMGEARYNGDRPLPWRTETAKQKTESELPPGRRLLTDSVEPLAQAIEEFVLDAASGKAGRKHTAVKYLAKVDPIHAAYLTARVTINAAAANKQLPHAAMSLSRAIEDHLNLQALAKTDPGLYRRVMSQVATATTASHRVGVLRHVQEKFDKVVLEWSDSDRILLGTKLIELFRDTAGLVDITRLTAAANRTPIMLVFTPEAQKWLEEGHRTCALLNPVHVPMVAPPKPWRSPYSGGYLSGLIKTKLVHTWNRSYMDELGGVDLSRVLAVVNAVQSTPWRVNKRILEVMSNLWDTGGTVAGLPRRTDLPLPPRTLSFPADTPAEALTVDQKDELKTWKAAAGRVYAENEKARSGRIGFAQKLWVANRFKDEEAIYFPHYLDFRGRMYPYASYMNPQGDDSGKGLLEFAQGKPLGEDGAYWLAVHLANLWGVDKVSLDDRIDWVMQNEERILASALDPYEEGAFWLEADSPFCALAAAMEWAGYKMHGEDFVSHLPIAMDGSCSGLQHFSALLRDEVGGAAVNLVPGDKPADVYTKVATRAQALSDASTNATMSAVWKGKVNRKVAKQPTMTMCYSATLFGMQGQIRAALGKLDAEGEKYLGGADNHEAAVYMANHVWSAIGDTVIAARSAMDWLKQVSKVCSAANMGVRWTTPMGLPVMQDYKESEEDRIKIHFGGERVRIQLRRETQKIAGGRQAAGIAPNYVHSLDSAHLMATVELGLANGLYDFAVIHDSFAVHACDTTLFNRVIREAFVAQYETNLLEKFRDEVIEQLQALAPEQVEKIPPLPRVGNLELERVIDSDFFFA